MKKGESPEDFIQSYWTRKDEHKFDALFRYYLSKGNSYKEALRKATVELELEKFNKK